MTVPEFFSQMRIVLKAAERSYEDWIKGKEINQDGTTDPWVQFTFPKDIEDFIEKNHPHSTDILDEDMQDISLKIESVNS